MTQIVDSLRGWAAGLSRRRGGRRGAALTFALLALNLFVAGFVVTGCAGLFGPRISVSQNEQTALQEGRDRLKKAEEAEAAGDKSEAQRIYTEAVGYYGAVANQFAGKPTGLEAQMEVARIQAEELNNLQMAFQTLRSLVKQYPLNSLGTSNLPQQARDQYDRVVGRLDEENSRTAWYKVMDFLVQRIAGGNSILALFIIAVLVTALTWPFRAKLIRQSREMAKFAPEMRKLQEKYKSDPLLYQEKTREFYKEHGVNPFAGCAPALLQWPITIVMYQLIVYYQFHFTGVHFLWINPAVGAISDSWAYPLTGALARNLSQPDTLLLLLFTFSTFVSMRLTPSTTADPQALEQQRMMSTFFPPFYFIMMLQWNIASAFVLYWLFSNVLGIAQQFIIYKTLPPVTPLVLKGGDDATPAGGSAASAGEAAKPLEANPKLVSPKSRRKK